MKYYVIAIHWDHEKNAKVKYIVGEFNKYFLAALFRDAYNKEFSSNSYVINSDDLINA